MKIEKKNTLEMFNGEIRRENSHHCRWALKCPRMVETACSGYSCVNSRLRRKRKGEQVGRTTLVISALIGSSLLSRNIPG